MKQSKYMATTALVAGMVCLFSACAGLFPGREEVKKPQEKEPKAYERVVGYLPNWSYGGYRDLDLTALTHINIAFCNPDRSGNFSAGIPDRELAAIVSAAHESGVKVLAALGGGGGCDNYPALVADSGKIRALDEKLLDFCLKYDLDGIDLDIELGSSNSIWNTYGAWCADLRGICDDNGLLLTTATAQWLSVKVSKETYARFDFVNVMAYDDDVNKSSHASYEMAINCMDYFTAQYAIPAEKLVLGVPFYGRGYTSAGALDWGSYLSFSELIARDEENFYRDVYNGIAYNGEETMRQKCALARNYGGIMIWEITLDAAGDYSLLSVIKEEMLS